MPVYTDTTVCGDPSRRHEFVLLYDVRLGNPNGDPDMDNMPRQDPQTNHGIVTDVCLKRKIRNYVNLAKGSEDGYRIFINDEALALNALLREAAEDEPKIPKSKKPADVMELRRRMCRRFYDVRMFGAVMSTGDHNAGQVRGPMQVMFSESISPVSPMDVAITRVAITKEADLPGAKKEGKDEAGKEKTTEMGGKYILPYGLYATRGYYSAPLAQQAGVTREDLEVFWEALANLWEFDRSAARGEMCPRGLYVFSHEHKFGNAPAHELLDRISCVVEDGIPTPRSFTQYRVTVDDADLPGGISLTRLIG